MALSTRKEKIKPIIDFKLGFIPRNDKDKAMDRRLVGRHSELGTLQRILDSKEPAFVAVYGRRRVGKTFLIREGLKTNLRFELTGTKDGSTADQLENFSLNLAKASKGKFPAKGVPKSWREAFSELEQWLETLPSNQKHVVFFDELPWLASARSGFLEKLDYFWNTWGNQQTNLILVVCGSAAAWMISKFLKAKGGLHNRVTHRIRLLPFDLCETREFLQSRSAQLNDQQITELYMAFGGVPLYLEQVQKGESAKQAIDRICFSKDGFLRNEFSLLYTALFDSADRHMEIVRALASKNCGLTRTDIVQTTRQTQSGRLSAILEELIECGFVKRCHPYGHRVRETIFRLGDEYSLFYQNWIQGWRKGEAGSWQKARGTPKWRTWAGLAFENLCMQHTGQIKAALGIAGVETEESAWRYTPAKDSGDNGAQIDMLIDRADACINLCEMKFTEGEFVIDERYARKLRERRETFRRITGTPKALFNTLVTTNGVKQNPYALELVDAEVKMKSLFAPSTNL